jgi:hypothetical protein
MSAMAHRGLLQVALAAAVLLAPLAGAQACNCPKEQLIKKYGTVSQIHPPQQPTPPLPPPLPISKVSAPASG